MKRAAVALLLVMALPALAQHLVEGEVRKLDLPAGKITLKHGPIESLDMPAMTMVFRVRDVSVLRNVKQGDRVRFSAEKMGDRYIVNRIEPAKTQ